MKRNAEAMRALKFTLFSLSAGVIQIASYTALYEWVHLTEWVSYLIALILSVVWNFTFNRKFTFRSANNVPIAMLKVAAFYAVFTPLSTWADARLVAIGWNGYVVTVLMMLANFVTEFLYDRFVVFGASIDSAVQEKE